MALAGLAVWSVAGVLDVLGGRPRRFTGSRMLAAGSLPIPTTFLLDPVPALEPASWRLRVSGAVAAPAELSLEELTGLAASELTAVLDCTGGWASENTWRGVPMSAVLARVRPRDGARWVEVRSATGWRSGFPLDEARSTLLATAVDDRALPQANGAPCRLVAPTRRGLDWTKWVTEIIVS
jgi:DMSO/TMAO reductase YedYZ molybdopterin-dependent catalytic subunit